MTREESIKTINEILKNNYLSIGECRLFEYEQEAMKVAVEALEQPEIIRCKDCKYCEEVYPGLFFCDSVDIVPVGQYVEPDGFCSMARRREK